MAEIFRLTLRQLLGRWRVLLIVFLASLPTLIVLLVKWQDPENAVYNQEFVQGMIDAMIVGGIMPIVTMTVAAAAFGNELEDRTLYYLVLKPLSRVHIALAKLVATFVLTAPVVVASGVVATALVGADAGAVFTVGIALWPVWPPMLRSSPGPDSSPHARFPTASSTCSSGRAFSVHS